MLWLVKIWQVSSRMDNIYSTLNLVYFVSWSWQSFVATCDVFNRLFPLHVQNEIQLLSGVVCYSWIVCLLGFWLRNTSLVEVGNPISDDIVFVFHLAWCVSGLQSLKRYWPYLIPFGPTSPMVSLSNYCIWCLLFISNLMKSSVCGYLVYARLKDLRQWSDRVSVLIFIHSFLFAIYLQKTLQFKVGITR